MQHNTHSTQSIRGPVEAVSPEELIQRLTSDNIELRQALTLKDAQIDELTNTLAVFKELIQELRDEIAILKGLKPKPKIAPSLLEGSKKKRANGTRDFNEALRKES